jgi:hypothetical protein
MCLNKTVVDVANAAGKALSPQPPHSSGHIISRLNPGDTIILNAGYGHPIALHPRRLTVVAVDHFSAHTTDESGADVYLMCRDGEGITHINGRQPIT